MTFQGMHIHPMGYAKLFTLYALRAQSSKKHRTGAEAPLNRISYSIRRNSLDQVDHSKTVPALVEQLQRIRKLRISKMLLSSRFAAGRLTLGESWTSESRWSERKRVPPKG
jgi:hypothetical protein